MYGSKGDVIKEFYASLLSVSAEFVRRSENTEEIEQLLKNGCRWPSSRVTLYLEYFEKNQRLIEYSLINIGSYLPHLVDVRWKIDYIVKVKLDHYKFNLRYHHSLKFNSCVSSDFKLIFRLVWGFDNNVYIFSVKYDGWIRGSNLSNMSSSWRIWYWKGAEKSKKHSFYM